MVLVQPWPRPQGHRCRCCPDRKPSRQLPAAVEVKCRREGAGARWSVEGGGGVVVARTFSRGNRQQLEYSQDPSSVPASGSKLQASSCWCNRGIHSSDCPPLQWHRNCLQRRWCSPRRWGQSDRHKRGCQNSRGRRFQPWGSIRRACHRIPSEVKVGQIVAVVVRRYFHRLRS